MKKTFLILCVALSLLACTQNAYKISGEVTDNSLDSTYVYLSERVNREWIKLDSTLIVNGKFVLNGKVDSVKVAYLKLQPKRNKDNSESYPFILEPGDIAARVDSTGAIVITGTTQNDVLNKYTIEINALRTKADELYNRINGDRNTPLSAAQKDTLEAGLKVFENETKKIEKEYALQNVNKMVGTHIFMTSFYDYTVEEKEALFARMNTKTKAIPRIAELIAATEVEKKTSKGQPYIDFSMTAPDGGTVKLSDYVGKTDYLLVDFWASWCPDCVASFPGLTAFYTRNKGTKFDIVGVSLDDDKDRWIRGIAKHKLTWHHLSDLQKWSSEGAKLYAVNAIPATVLIDKNGKIAGRNLELKEIQELLNQIVTK